MYTCYLNGGYLPFSSLSFFALFTQTNTFSVKRNDCTHTIVGLIVSRVKCVYGWFSMCVVMELRAPRRSQPTTRAKISTIQLQVFRGHMVQRQEGERGIYVYLTILMCFKRL